MNGTGIWGDTMILTLRSGPLPLSAFEGEVYEPVYGWVGGRIVVGLLEEVISLGDMDVIRVVLDGGCSVRVVGTQPFMLREGVMAMARDLKPGTSLMPLYLREDAHGYPTYRQVAGNGWIGDAPESTDRKNWRKTIRLVAEMKLGRRLPPRTYCSNGDSDRQNCHPDNVNVKLTEDVDVTYRTERREWIENVVSAQKFVGRHGKLARPIRYVCPSLRGRVNHRVVGIHDAGFEDCYAVRVTGTESLAIGNESGGVFVGAESW